MRVATSSAILATSLAMLLGPLGAAKPVVPVPFTRSGAWAAEPREGFCTLSQNYSVPDGAAALILKPTPLYYVVETLLAVPRSKAQGPDAGVASIRIGPDGQPSNVGYRAYDIPAQKLRVYAFYLNRPILDGLRNAAEVIITADKSWSLDFQLFSDGASALRTCERTLLTSWGVPSSVDPAGPSGENHPRFLSETNYPLEAKRARQEGRSVALVQVGTDGKPLKCRIITSSGWPLLDQATLDVACHKVSFSPARDDNEKPIVGWVTIPMAWKLDS